VEFKDYYKVMGVARDATEAQIKQAYRKLARKYHPDVSKEKDAEARFKEVGEAYEVLKSPEKRAAYDQVGKGHRPGEDFRPPPNWDSGFEFSGAGPGNADYSDFFDALFGAHTAEVRSTVLMPIDGVGMLAGFWLAGRVTDIYAVHGVHDWRSIWLVPAGVAALVFAMRNILMDGIAPPMSLILNLTMAACVALGLGFLIFARMKPFFYEHI